MIIARAKIDILIFEVATAIIALKYVLADTFFVQTTGKFAVDLSQECGYAGAKSNKYTRFSTSKIHRMFKIMLETFNCKCLSTKKIC